MLDSISIEQLPGTSSQTIKRLTSINIKTYSDLLHYFPARYDDYSMVTSLDRMQPGETVTVKGRIEQMKTVYARTGITIQKAQLVTNQGTINISWFNQPYLVRVLQDKMVSLSGEVKLFKNSVTLDPKEYEVISSFDSPTLHTGRLVPIYPEKRGLSSHLLREKIAKFVLPYLHQDNEVENGFPKEIVDQYGLMDLREACNSIHFPESFEKMKESRRRFAFEELFTIQLFTHEVRKEWKKETVGYAFSYSDKIKKSILDFDKHLPFSLTDAQKKATKEIMEDMKQKHPMNRFLQGDVGSGKTVVAAEAAYFASLNKKSTLFMAPTEILAAQHFGTLQKLFAHTKIKVGIVTHSQKLSKEQLRECNIIVGTHALLNQKIEFKEVGLVVIDEQHRFGVVQRAQLKDKGINPHLLTMTATPIPRTVVLTLYGELDLSVINEMPKGRKSIKTFNVPQAKRESGYEWIQKQVKTLGTQVFVVCPMIEESEKESMKSIKAATKEYERLQKIFPQLKIALLHGKMKSAEKDNVMNDFKEKKYNILVSTSVVEVGIDVPNATIMVIEGAERFGLAQLHQMRGRVGRGSEQSYCLLYTESEDQGIHDRLNFFAKTQNGMELAEYDLKMRGGGTVFGTRQHGEDELQVASLSDYGLIAETRKAVEYFDDHFKLNDYPLLRARLEAMKLRQISRD